MHTASNALLDFILLHPPQRVNFCFFAAILLIKFEVVLQWHLQRVLHRSVCDSIQHAHSSLSQPPPDSSMTCCRIVVVKIWSKQMQQRAEWPDLWKDLAFITSSRVHLYFYAQVCWIMSTAQSHSESLTFQGGCVEARVREMKKSISHLKPFVLTPVPTHPETFSLKSYN